VFANIASIKTIQDDDDEEEDNSEDDVSFFFANDLFDCLVPISAY
jgi:hypothetical protein